MKSCESDGAYCFFHNRMMAFIEKLENQEWFLDYQEVHKKEDWVWNEEIRDYEEIQLFKDHLDFEFLIPIIKDTVQAIEFRHFDWKRKKRENHDVVGEKIKSSAAKSRIDMLLEGLEKIDFGLIFHESHEWQEYLEQKADEEFWENYHAEHEEEYEMARKKRENGKDGTENVENESGEEENSGDFEENEIGK